MSLFFNLKEDDYFETDHILNYYEIRGRQSIEKRLFPAFKTHFSSLKEFEKLKKEINKDLRISEKRDRNEREDKELKKYNQGLLKRKPTKEKSFPYFIVLDQWDDINKIAYYRYCQENKRN